MGRQIRTPSPRPARRKPADPHSASRNVKESARRGGFNFLLFTEGQVSTRLGSKSGTTPWKATKGHSFAWRKRARTAVGHYNYLLIHSRAFDRPPFGQSSEFGLPDYLQEPSTAKSNSFCRCSFQQVISESRYA